MKNQYNFSNVGKVPLYLSCLKYFESENFDTAIYKVLKEVCIHKRLASITLELITKNNVKRTYAWEEEQFAEGSILSVSESCLCCNDQIFANVSVRYSKKEPGSVFDKDCINTLSFLVYEYSRNMRIQALRGLSFVDDMLGIQNRNALERKFNKLAKKTRGTFAIFLIDVNKLKKINDTFGHSAGDLCLKMTAQRLKQIVDKKYIYRYGGDEFILIFENIDRQESQQIYTKLKARLKINAIISSSVGYAWGDNPRRYKQVMDLADRNLYAVKKSKYVLKQKEMIARRVVYGIFKYLVFAVLFAGSFYIILCTGIFKKNTKRFFSDR